ncbi:MAG: SPFH domain-containing protein, partial [Hyphomicrobium sp.]|uniref:SPFH domain-containing protein n=1 Tax=Hyphomicrobium sp. TaxID=82 RepID=UPI003565C91C
VGKGSNVYYEFPKWLPKYGVEVRELPVSNFGVDLPKYSAYDKDRVPFEVDVKAFFHIADTNKAAEKVASYQDLLLQLNNVVQGAVRSILAKSKLEQIMEERSMFGQLFTDAVKDDLKSWGVEPIKSIELMDVRDAQGSNVIHQIMAKRISAIDMESRTEVAKNTKSAEQAELEARKEVALTAAETERLSGEAQAKSLQAIGIAQAESIKNRGIAEQTSFSEIAKAERLTAEQKMEVIKVTQIKQAEIDKEKAIINTEQEKRQVELVAEAEKFKVETDAKAQLEAKKKEAEAIKSVGEAQADVIKAKGLSEAEAKKQMELANVSAQTTLAKEIGENESYQNYLVKIREVEITGEVNKVQYQSLATALNGADLKLLVNSGDVHSGLGKFSDILSSKGGAATNGLFESLKQTTEGAGLLALLDRLTKKEDDKK